MEPFVFKNDAFFTIDKWMNLCPGLTAGMTSKNGGKSTGFFQSLNTGFHVGDHQDDVYVNRQRIADILDFPLDFWVGAEQTHGTVIRKIAKSDRGTGAKSYGQAFKGTDGFYTNAEGVLLTLCYADCVPLFFLAPEHGMIGTAHAGWKGTVGQIAREMILAWYKEGIVPEQILVTIGPSICKKCYIVDNRVINLVEKVLEDVDKKPYNLIEKGQYSLDLRELNRQILLQAGIPEKNIMVSNLCSSCDDDVFFSHRRDQGKTGRMLSFIGWKET